MQQPDIEQFGQHLIRRERSVATMKKHIRDARCFLHLQMVRESYGEYLNVFQAETPRAIRIAETSAYAQSIYEYDPKGKAVEAFEGLVGEVIDERDINVGVLQLRSTPFSLNCFWE